MPSLRLVRLRQRYAGLSNALLEDTDMHMENEWPSLPYEEWKDTYATLHLWTQIVGKVKLELMPWTNHAWHSALYLTPRGLTTLAIPYGMRTFDVRFDFVEHELKIRTADGESRTLQLRPHAVADFYQEVLGTLDELGLPVQIRPMPNEIPDAIPCDEDRVHTDYDGEYANRCWHAMLHAYRVFTRFRARYAGKSSPVHFFWGSFDLAVTRFSGRRAPPHPGGVPNLPDWVAREAYSHEVSSVGFWPGGAPLPEPVFYSYAYPEPAGFATAKIEPPGAYYHPQLHEFVLPYEQVRNAPSPDDMLMAFCQSTYGAAASLGNWDRAELEFRPEDWRAKP
jgi:hypothetical protein